MEEPQPLIAVQDWYTDGVPGLHHVSFELREGEIVGVFGLVGSGAELIAKGLAGQVPVQGHLTVNHQVRRPFRNPGQARKAGVAYVPAERKVDGLALSQSIKANIVMLILDRISVFGIMRTRAEHVEASRLAQRHDVRYANIRQAVGELSGGNQQKVLIGSRLASGPKVLVLHEPTRGVDIGARAQIHRLLQSTVHKGTSVVLVTSDSAEAVNLSDRLLIMRNGEIVAELSGDSKSEERALAVATRATERGVN
jgi:ABC-type sugar transport system ATPase subunit